MLTLVDKHSLFCNCEERMYRICDRLFVHLCMLLHPEGCCLIQCQQKIAFCFIEPCTKAPKSSHTAVAAPAAAFFVRWRKKLKGRKDQKRKKRKRDVDDHPGRVRKKERERGAKGGWTAGPPFKSSSFIWTGMSNARRAEKENR